MCSEVAKPYAEISQGERRWRSKKTITKCCPGYGENFSKFTLVYHAF